MAESEHSKFSPSSSEEWLNCAGSIAATAKALPDKGNKFAAQGTVAHGLAADLLEGRLSTFGLMGKVGQVVRTKDGFDVTIDEEMVGHIFDYKSVIDVDLEDLMRDARPAPIHSKTERTAPATRTHPAAPGTWVTVIYRTPHKPPG